MVTHPFWGNVEQDWAGFSAETTFSHPFFENGNVEIFLGEEYDEDGEEIEDPPTRDRLSAFADTFRNFSDNIESRLDAIQLAAFERYQKLYAKYYENPEESGAPALGIDSPEKHNVHIKEIMHLRILEDDSLKITIRYALDTEHGLEFKFSGDQIVAIGGISET
jgi:hypothetical protein